MTMAVVIGSSRPFKIQGAVYSFYWNTRVLRNGLLRASAEPEASQSDVRVSAIQKQRKAAYNLAVGSCSIFKRATIHIRQTLKRGSFHDDDDGPDDDGETRKFVCGIHSKEPVRIFHDIGNSSSGTCLMVD